MTDLPPVLPSTLEVETSYNTYSFTLTRYIKTVAAQSQEAQHAKYTATRNKLNTEIANLRKLAKMRHDAAWMAAKKYRERLPDAVTARGFRAPSALEKASSLGAVDPLYRAAKKTSAELEEINELLKKKLDQLVKLENETREALTAQEEALTKQLKGDMSALAYAMRADPLLAQAFKHWQDAVSEHNRLQAGADAREAEADLEATKVVPLDV